MLAWGGGPPADALQSLLQPVYRLLKDRDLGEWAPSNVGGLLMELLRCAGGQLVRERGGRVRVRAGGGRACTSAVRAAPHCRPRAHPLVRHVLDPPAQAPALPGLLGALSARLAVADDSSLVQSLLTVVAQLVLWDLQRTVDCLAVTQLPEGGGSALEGVMRRWCERQIEVRTAYDIRLTISALGALLVSGHPALEGIQVRQGGRVGHRTLVCACMCLRVALSVCRRGCAWTGGGGEGDDDAAGPAVEGVRAAVGVFGRCCENRPLVAVCPTEHEEGGGGAAVGHGGDGVGLGWEEAAAEGEAKGFGVGGDGGVGHGAMPRAKVSKPAKAVMRWVSQSALFARADSPSRSTVSWRGR